MTRTERPRAGAETLHATLVVLGEAGLLITGASGQGKSALALALLAQAASRGLHARLVGDDRVRVLLQGQRLVGRGHPVLTGRIEARGLGLLDVDSMDAAILRGVVTLADAPARMPEPEDETAEILGIRLPCITLRADRDLQARAHLVIDWTERLFAGAKKLS